MNHGFLDQVCHRKELRQRLISLLRYTCADMPAFKKPTVKERHTAKIKAGAKA